MAAFRLKDSFRLGELLLDDNNQEESSDGGSDSNSDDEPEDLETDDEDDECPEEDFALARNWQTTPPVSKVANVRDLSNECGLTTKSEGAETIADCFRLFIDDEIMEKILLYTNMRVVKSARGDRQPKLVDRIELEAFLGLLIIGGRFRESRDSHNDMWTSNESYSRPVYSAMLSRDRFKSILRDIQFDDPITRKNRKREDKFAPLRDISDIFVKNCSESYRASDVGCVGGRLMSFKGRCSFKVFMPGKQKRYGLKIWTLCDSETMYCCNMEVYTGKRGCASEKQASKRAIKDLTDVWDKSGRCVTLDDNFPDIGLAEELLEKNIFSVGPVRKNERGVPEGVVRVQHRTQYSSEFIFTDKLTLVSYVPKRSTNVLLLSSLHGGQNLLPGECTSKPQIMNYYNATKGSVEAFDNLLGEYSCRRCTRRWPLSLFYHYIDIAAYNAFIIWSLKYPEWEKPRGFHGRRRTFLERLSEELAMKNIDRRASAIEECSVGLHGRIIRAIEATGRKIVKLKKPALLKRARCSYCIGNDNKYSSVCDSCKRHVCGTHSTQFTKCYICENNVV